MAITYSSQTGSIVTSYGMDEVLGPQTQQTGNNQVVVSDDIQAAGNGQIGTVGNDATYPTYVGRKVVINLASFMLKKDLSLESPAQTYINALTYDSTNDVIIAGAYPDGQLWISGDGGETWTLKKDLSNESPSQVRIHALTYDSTNDVIIAGTAPDGQLWKSDDAGETWTLKKDLGNESPAQTYIYSLTYDSTNDVIIAGTYPDAQIWVSDDAGETWTLKKDLGNESPSQDEVFSLTFDSTNDVIIAGTAPDAQLWASDDAGETWALKKDLSNESNPQYQIQSLTFDSTNDVIIAGTGGGAQLWASDDGGETWTLKKDLEIETNPQLRIHSLAFDSGDGVIVAGTYPDAQLWVSDDAGETWTLKKDLENATPSQDYVYALTYDSANDVIIAGTRIDGQLWVGKFNSEQERMVVSQAAGTGNTIILTVNEDWDTNPVETDDTIHVFYVIDDLETGGVSGGISLNTKTGLYELSNLLTIGNETDPAGMLLHNAAGLELSDSGAPGATPALYVKDNARFDVGYEQAGRSVSGGIITAVHDGIGEQLIEWAFGSKGFIRDLFLWAQLIALKFEHLKGADATFESSRILSATYGTELFNATLKDCSITGKGGAGEFVRLDTGTVIDEMDLLFTSGFHSADGDTDTETIEVRNVFFIGNTPLITIAAGKTWNIVNPIWDPDFSDQTDLDFLSGSDNTLNWKTSVIVIVQESDGTKLQDAMVIVYEDTQLADLVIEVPTDSGGAGGGDFLYKNIDAADATAAPTVTTYGGHALRIDKWLYTPFIAILSSANPTDSIVTLIEDGNIVQTTQATALTAGSGVTWTEDANPSSIIAFTGGSGTLAVGNTVTGGTSGADGIVTKIVDGDQVAGTVHLKTRDAVDFSGTETLSNGSGWTATLTSGSQQDFSIWIDAISISMQTLYDYLAALTSETTLSATGEIIHEWGRDQQARALFLGTAGFFTERSYGKGVFVTNFGSGTIEKFTDDAGGTWTPPTSVTVEVTVLDDSTGLPLQYANVRLHKTSDKSEIMSKATDVNGEASISYNYVSVLDIDGWVRQWDLLLSDYVQKNISGQITASGFSQIVRLVPIN